MGDFLKEVPHAPQELKKKKQERSRERFSYLCKGKKVRCLAGTAASGGALSSLTLGINLLRRFTPSPLPIRSTIFDSLQTSASLACRSW